MLRRLIPIVLALAVLGIVTGIAALMIVAPRPGLGRRAVLAVRGGDDRLGAAGRDDARHHPLRPGDDRLLRVAGRDLRHPRRAAHRGRPGHRLHRRDQRPDPVRDHADPDQGRARAGSSSRPRPCRRRSPRSSSRSSSPWPSRATDWGEAADRVRLATTDMSTVLFKDFVLPFEIVSVLLLAAVDRRRLPRQAREGRTVVSDSLDAYLDPVGDAVRDRVVRLPRPAQRDQHADVDRADAQRGQPRDRRVRRVRRRRALTASARPQGSIIALMVMAVAAAEAPSAWPSYRIYRNKKTPLVDEYDAMRQQSTRRSRSLDPRARRPADGGVPDHGADRAAAGQAGALDPGHRDLRRLGHRDGACASSVLTGAAPLAPGLRDVARLRGRRWFEWIPADNFLRRRRLRRRRADGLPADRRDDDRPAGPRLLDRLHEPRPGLLALLRLPQPVHVQHAAAGPGRQLPRRLRGLGAGRPVELPAHRLLVPQALGGAGGQEGVHRQPRRRRRFHPRDHADLRQPRARSTSARSSSRIGELDATTITIIVAARVRRARWARAPSSRSTSGCRTRWRARPRCPP